MKKCDDCGNEIKRGTRCKHCGRVACGWCYNHHHGVSSVFYTPCDGQPKIEMNGYFDRVAAEQKMRPTPESLASSQAVVNADNLSQSDSESKPAQVRVI